MRLGHDFTLSGLREDGYDAVFLGVGAPHGTRLGIPNEDAQGVTDAIRFLREYNLRGSVPVGKKVIVIGGGNAAVDAARTAVRLGASSVTILYRRTREEMPAYAEEVEEAEHEGVLLKMLVSPSEIVVENGRVTGVLCSHMALGEFDRSGRRRPEACEGRTFVEEGDQVIAAIGQKLDLESVLDGLDVELTSWNFVWSDRLTGQTSVEWLFAGGDAARGPSSVVEAVGAGERAAVGIDKYLTNEEHAFWRMPYEVDTSFDPDAEPSEAPRACIKLLPIAKRRENFNEVELPFEEKTALREACRCLRCDYGVETNLQA